MHIGKSVTASGTGVVDEAATVILHKQAHGVVAFVEAQKNVAGLAVTECVADGFAHERQQLVDMFVGDLVFRRIVDPVFKNYVTPRAQFFGDGF